MRIAHFYVLQLRTGIYQLEGSCKEAGRKWQALEVGVVAAAVPALYHQPLDFPAWKSFMIKSGLTLL